MDLITKILLGLEALFALFLLWKGGLLKKRGAWPVSLLLLAVFTTLFVCGIRIAHRAPDRLGRLLAYGLSFLMFFQVLFNIGVVTGCLPTKGLALPFISYGGTNLMSSLIAVGILFNIGRQIELPKPRPRSTISPVFS